MITQLTETLYHVISDLNIMIECGFHTDLTQHYKALEASIREYKETPEALYKELFEPWCREDFSRFCRLVNIIENKNEDWQENSIKILPDFAVIFNELCFIYDEIAMRQPELVKSIKVDTAEGVKMPDELNTDRARKYFARAVADGLMSEQFEWLASQSLLACFCREMSVKLDLGKGYSSEGQKRLSWKPFEALFNVKAKNLTTSLNDIKKTGQDPIGIEKVEAIFKD